MTHSRSSDPFQGRRNHWRILTRMAHRLQWAVWIFAWLGWMDRNGQWRRDLSIQIGQLEHGLRCLLVLMRRKCRSDGCRQQTQPPLSAVPTQGFDLGASHTPALDGFPELDIMRARRARFGMTVARFADAAGPVETAGTVGVVHSAGKPAQRHGRHKVNALQSLHARMAAIADVLADAEPHALRMARALKRAGLSVRALIVIPANKCAASHAAPCAGLSGLARAAPQLIDTS